MTTQMSEQHKECECCECEECCPPPDPVYGHRWALMVFWWRASGVEAVDVAVVYGYQGA